jgi:hypothetical protein
MSELTLELYAWEKKAFEEGAQLALQVEGDIVVVTGKPEAMHRALPLKDLHWVELEGYIRALVYDPIPHRGRQLANALLKRIQRRRANGNSRKV